MQDHLRTIMRIAYEMISRKLIDKNAHHAAQKIKKAYNCAS
jgi:hypothetical protein